LRVVTVRSLHVYPVKSARGLTVEDARVGDRGFEGDRRFLIADPNARFLTQRELPRMALIVPTVEKQQLFLDAPGMERLAVPLHPERGEAKNATIWRDQCAAISVGEIAAEWLSRFLGRACELLYMPDATRRNTDEKFGPRALVGFADGYPFLLVSEASLAEVARHGADVPMNRFRPNIVVGGCGPFAEDGWRTIRIGPITFHLVKPCARCPIPNVDQETAAVGKEVTLALASFRRRGNDVLFAMNLTHVGEGTIRAGDRVEIVDPVSAS
jgi:uncharacterized protein YcbX